MNKGIGFKLKKYEKDINNSCNEGNEAVKQVSQRSCECLISESVQSQIGWSMAVQCGLDYF